MIEVSSIQRSFNTLQYYTGTHNGVLIIEVSAVQRFVIEGSHCAVIPHIYIAHVLYSFTQLYLIVYCTYSPDIIMCSKFGDDLGTYV